MNAMSNINRRAAIGAALLAPIAAATCASEPAYATNRAEWDQAFAEMKRLLILVRASDERNDAAHNAYKADWPRLDMIDWKEFHFVHGDATFADRYDVEADWRKFVDGEGQWWWARDAEKRKADHRAALDSMLEYRRLKTEAATRHDVFAIAEENDRLASLLDAAEDRLIRMPSPHAEALAWKLDFLFGPRACEPDGSCPSWTMEWVKPVIDDAVRLARKGAQS